MSAGTVAPKSMYVLSTPMRSPIGPQTARPEALAFPTMPGRLAAMTAACAPSATPNMSFTMNLLSCMKGRPVMHTPRLPTNSRLKFGLRVASATVSSSSRAERS